MEFAHAFPNIKVILIQAVDQNVSLAMTAHAIKLALEINALTLVQERAGKVRFAMLSIIFQYAHVLKAQVEMHSFNAHLIKVCSENLYYPFRILK